MAKDDRRGAETVNIQSSLRRAPNQPTGESTMEEMRKKAWREQGVVVIRPEEILDEWTRQALVNEATKRYGARGK